MMPVALLGLSEVSKADFNASHTGGCNSFTHQSLLSAETDPFRLDSQFEFSRTYSHQYQALFRRYGEISFVDSTIAAYMEREGIEYLYSFDDDFDALDGVTRLDTADNPFN